MGDGSQEEVGCICLRFLRAWIYIGLRVVATLSFGSGRVFRKACSFLIVTIYAEDGARLCACLCMRAFCTEGKVVYMVEYGDEPQMECLHD